MDDTECFNKNLARWAVSNPEGAAIVSNTICDQVSILTLMDGQLNLTGSDGSGGVFFYHSQEGPEQEAKAWFASLPLEGVQIAYIYGVGLGYAYFAARPWLRSDEKLCLVFLEDDPQVIRRLLETENGTLLLNDPQVSLLYFSEQLFPEKSDDKIVSLGSILTPFTLYPFTVSPSPCYECLKGKHANDIKAVISFFTMIHRATTLEYSNSGVGFFNNFFRNYLLLPQGYLADRMFGKFSGIPAIICGAGPSLDSNISLLGKMYDRALIFAGGTAMNALNGRGMLPHFGVGIDPNPDHFTRIVMNHAYETPFLYRNRMLHEALAFVHGDRLCVGGSCGYEVANWFQKRLGISENDIVEGNNVLNFSLAIAYAMGCNPIVLVGIDLAYSQERSYASGIISHPIHDRKFDFRTRRTQDEVLLKNDIFGNPVATLWKWVGESLWYSKFAEDHSDVLIINATEGGIGFAGIENMSLKDVSERYMTKRLDLDTRVHGEIQNSALPKDVTVVGIRTGMRELAVSLKSCEKRCQTLEELQFQAKGALGQPRDDLIQKILEERTRLEEETAYNVILKAIDDACHRFHGLEWHRLKCHAGQAHQDEDFAKRMELELKQLASLKEAAHLNAFLIDAILSENEMAHEVGPDNLLQGLLPAAVQDGAYRMEGLKIAIEDPELNLSHAEHVPAGAFRKEQLFYQGGSLKCEQCYKGDILHGPSTFYDENGTITARSWFLDGQRQGKMWTYYASGRLNSLQRFRAGQRHGIQEYYYPSGRTKSVLPYENGQMSGLVLLYHPNGREARKLRFVGGKRYGTECIWDERGILIIESQYLNDMPIGTAKKWYPNGVLASEIVYDDHSKRLSAQMWKPDGSPVDMKERERSDYFYYVAKQTGKMSESLGDVFTQLSKMAPILFEAVHKNDSSAGFTTEFEELQKKMEELKQFGEMIKMEFTSEEDKEALWQDEAGVHELEQQLMQHKREMDAEMGSIEQNFKYLLDETIKRLEQDGGRSVE